VGGVCFLRGLVVIAGNGIPCPAVPHDGVRAGKPALAKSSRPFRRLSKRSALHKAFPDSFSIALGAMEDQSGALLRRLGAADGIGAFVLVRRPWGMPRRTLERLPPQPASFTADERTLLMNDMR